MKPKKCIEMEYSQTSQTISLSLDGGATHENIHFQDGFEKAFDRLVDILSQDYDVAVNKSRYGCDECQETGTQYMVRK